MIVILKCENGRNTKEGEKKFHKFRKEGKNMVIFGNHHVLKSN